MKSSETNSLIFGLQFHNQRSRTIENRKLWLRRGEGNSVRTINAKRKGEIRRNGH